MQPQLASADDVFASALSHFTTTCDWLRGDAMGLAHSDIETHVLLASREIARRMFQAHLDLRARQERQAPRPAQVAADAAPRTQACNLDTVVGRVRVRRWAWQATGRPTVRPLDEALALSREVYSSGVRRLACEQLADRSVGRCTEALQVMGIAVPRRQAEQLAVRMAQDFETFYETRERPANDTADDDTLLVLSADAKGVRMVPRSLREATRKAAAREASRSVRGDPMADRQERSHDRRMAVVTAIWDPGPVRADGPGGRRAAQAAGAARDAQAHAAAAAEQAGGLRDVVAGALLAQRRELLLSLDAFDALTAGATEVMMYSRAASGAVVSRVILSGVDYDAALDRMTITGVCRDVVGAACGASWGWPAAPPGFNRTGCSDRCNHLPRPHLERPQRGRLRLGLGALRVARLRPRAGHPEARHHRPVPDPPRGRRPSSCADARGPVVGASARRRAVIILDGVEARVAVLSFLRRLLGFLTLCLVEAFLAAALTYLYFAVLFPQAAGGRSGAYACAAIGFIFLAPLLWLAYVVICLAAKVVVVLIPHAHRHWSLAIYWGVTAAMVVRAYVGANAPNAPSSPREALTAFVGLIPALVLTFSHFVLIPRLAPGSPAGGLAAIFRRRAPRPPAP